MFNFARSNIINNSLPQTQDRLVKAKLILNTKSQNLLGG